MLGNKYCTEGRTRTGTGINSHRILSPVRLPVPPPRQTVYYNLADKYRDLEIFKQINLISFIEITEKIFYNPGSKIDKPIDYQT